MSSCFAQNNYLYGKAGRIQLRSLKLTQTQKITISQYHQFYSIVLGCLGHDKTVMNN